MDSLEARLSALGTCTAALPKAAAAGDQDAQRAAGGPAAVAPAVLATNGTSQFSSSLALVAARPAVLCEW